MSELAEYDTITRDKVIVEMSCAFGEKLQVFETAEILTVECEGTIEKNGEEAPLAEFISRLDVGEKVKVTFERIKDK